MNGKTHLLIGTASGLGLAASAQADVRSALLLVASAALGSLLPDIDERHSKISRAAGFVRAPAALLFKHRGFTHSMLAAFAVAVCAWLIHPLFGVGLFFGYALHLVADMLTRSGVPLFWPLRAHCRLLPKVLCMETDGNMEIAVYVVALVACLILLQANVVHWIF